ncbi:MAG TPA: hypothetical protein VL463_11545 [Kofleriaceae bacterium]|nr:hypothetical protein [Kofleriaceae bacterium]
MRRACALSVVMHVVLAGGMWWWMSARDDEAAAGALVDIELAPEAPQAQQLAAEKEREAAEQAQAAAEEEMIKPAQEPGDFVVDAGVPDARVRPDARPRPDARVKPDAGIDAASDEMIAAGSDGGVIEDGGTEVAVAGSDGGVAVDAGAVDEDHADAIGASTVAVAPGTASNLLSYFPKGHVVTLMLRFDRLRGTEWTEAAEKLLAPMPDYQTIIGDRAVHIADVFDTLVISTPSPRDIVATTLVGRTTMAPADLRALLDHDGANVAWTAATGGALGHRRPGPLVFPGDKRVFLSPFTGWIVLAQPADLGSLTKPGRGDLDALVAPEASLPEWLKRVRTIETESGTPTGPALVLTMSALAGRYELPDMGLGVTSLPAPDRITLALEVDARGFIARGNLRFASDADAIEMEKSLRSIHDQVVDSRLLRAVLAQTHALNLVKGLSVVRTGRRVAYATSLSISDGRALMALAAKMIGDYYAAQRAPAPPPGP